VGDFSVALEPGRGSGRGAEVTGDVIGDVIAACIGESRRRGGYVTAADN